MLFSAVTTAFAFGIFLLLDIEAIIQFRTVMFAIISATIVLPMFLSVWMTWSERADDND